MRLILLLSIILQSFLFSTLVNADIVNGEEINLNTSALAKTTVAIFEGNKYLCSGVLIAKNAVLSSAHCFKPNEKLSENIEPEPYRIYFSSDVTHISTNKPVSKQVVKIIRRFDFEVEGGLNNKIDLAVLKFKGRAPKGYISTKILPRESYISTDSKLLIAGFGSTEYDFPFHKGSKILRKGEVLLEKDFQDVVLNRTINILSTSLGQIPCVGDSGGPVFYDDSNRLFVIGIISGGSISCSESAIITNLVNNEVNDWLESSILRLLK